MTPTPTDLEEGKKAIREGDRRRTLADLLRWAEQGDGESQFYLGYLYSFGAEGEFDKREAVRWYEAALAQGIHLAAYDLAKLTDPRIGRAERFNVPPIDGAMSAGYYQRATDGLRPLAERGDAKAAEVLGTIYLLAAR